MGDKRSCVDNLVHLGFKIAILFYLSFHANLVFKAFPPSLSKYISILPFAMQPLLLGACTAQGWQDLSDPMSSLQGILHVVKVRVECSFLENSP